jgi:molybdopterin/thiamine biosynthesis adenylyltransferase/rhodanese-related sulfurtransferase
MSESAPALTPPQFDRYRRHLTLPEMGVEGQRKLLDASVLLIGAGGLGCPLAQYLAAAGVGHLGLLDDDVVDASNLQRQVLYGTADVGRQKVDVAIERVQAQNPDVRTTGYAERLDSANALSIFDGYDIIVDGTDNFPTRYLSNDACVLLGKPNVYGSIFRFEGQATVFDSREQSDGATAHQRRNGPCYRCLYPEPPPPGAVPSCAEGGVLGVLPGIIAMIQATETIKLITEIGTPLTGRLLLYDAMALEFREFSLRKDPECPVCGEEPSVTELIDYEGFCGMPAVEGPARKLPSLQAVELHQRRGAGDPFLLLDVRDPDEFERAHIGGSTLIPLSELEQRIAELDDWKDRPVVVHCHHGPRSERACELLIARGFAQAQYLDGGIEAWSLTVDPDVERY